MLLDARNISANEELWCDVCIVGAGTAGITLAREFVGGDVSVCLLESGGEKPDRKTQSLYRGENVGRPYFSLETARARYLGGSSNRWFLKIGDGKYGARVRKFDPLDFEPRDWVPHSGWPFGADHLEPFYERAQTLCRVTPATYDPDSWSDPSRRPVMRFSDDRVNTVIFKFCPREPYVKDYIEEVETDAHIRTILYANVTGISTDEYNKSVRFLRVNSLEGNEFKVKARIYVLAAGGIETPRLMLNSNENQKSGVGNEHDLVGRFFMEHPHFWSGILIPFNQELADSTALYNHVHTVDGVPVVGKLALSEPTVRKEKLLNFVAQLNPRIVLKSDMASVIYPGVESESVDSIRALRKAVAGKTLSLNLFRHAQKILLGADDIGRAVYRKILRTAVAASSRKKILIYRLENMSEQAPNPDSRVMLSHEKDELGQPRVNLNWQLCEADMRSAIRSQEIMGDAFEKSGIGRLHITFNDKTPPRKITGGWHHMGTTRMHPDPKQGVVDINSRVHGKSNLFIAGPSVFPTVGYANPILSLVALTLRLADHLKQQLKES